MVVLAALPCRDAFLTARDNRPALFTSFIQDTLCAGIVLKDGDPPTKMTKTQIDGIIFGAIKFTEKLDKKGDLGELTQDMAAAIYVYTCESPFYKQLNKLLRDEDRTALQPFFPYLRLLLTALRRLPKIERHVYRGVGLDLQDQYPEGETVVWWSVSSTTKTMKVLKDFLGESGKRTIFIVEVKSARDIMKYSWKTTEDELILLPGTVFKVTSVLPQGDLTMVNLEEDLTAPDMIDSGEDDYQMCDPESFYAVLEPDDAVQYASPVDVGGSGGGGGKASIPKVFQCERPNPRGGNCKNRRAGDGKFCKGHSCTHSGCSASKSSKDAFCDQHSDADARTDEPVAASPAFTVEGQPPPASLSAAAGDMATCSICGCLTEAWPCDICGADAPSYSSRHVGEPWYVAKMSREECEKAVTSGDPGDFLVRDSSDGKKMVIVLNGRGAGETAKYQIVPGDNHMYIVSGVPYRHVSEVLQSMRDNHPNGNDGQPLPLANVANYGQTGHRIYIAPLNEEQFEMLDPRATIPEELPAYCRNMDHNRYWDIMPNGITRVKLTVENDDQSTDYINANYVRGYGRNVGIVKNCKGKHGLVDFITDHEGYTCDVCRKQLSSGSKVLACRACNYDVCESCCSPGAVAWQAGAKKYIAAQGPLATSLERFIRMIWECNVLTIVMVTGLVEAGEVTCERYWPEEEDEPMHIGRFVVRLLGTEYEDGYRFHDLEITTANGKKKELRHYWFDSWPDHGVPENSLGEIFPDNALHMLTSAHTEQRRLADLGERDAPLLVHCSAGIGRTGTFITIDHAMDAIKSKRKVDLNDIVEHLREDRMGMIQHTSQYKFAYV